MISAPLARSIARRLPSPQHVGWPLRVLPWPIQRGLLEKLLNSHFQALLAAGEFDFLEQHSFGVEVWNLRLRWVFGIAGRISQAGLGPQPWPLPVYLGRV